MPHANTRRYANVNSMLDQRRSVPALNQHYNNKCYRKKLIGLVIWWESHSPGIAVSMLLAHRLQRWPNI